MSEIEDIEQPYMDQKIMVPFHHKLPKDYTFPQRLFDFLKMPEYSHAIHWSRDGKHVVVKDQESLLRASHDLTNKSLQEDAQPLFNWATFQSFRRQMSIWGFMQANNSGLSKEEFGSAQHLYTHVAGINRSSTRKELLNLLRNAPPKLDRLIKAGKPLPPAKIRKSKSLRSLPPYSRSFSDIDSGRDPMREYSHDRKPFFSEMGLISKERPRRAAADECNRKLVQVTSEDMELEDGRDSHRLSSGRMSISSIAPASEDDEDFNPQRKSTSGVPNLDYYEGGNSPGSTSSTLSTSPSSSDAYYHVQPPPVLPAPYYESDYSGMLDLHMIPDYIPISPLSAAFASENIGMHRFNSNSNSYRGWNNGGNYHANSQNTQNGNRLSSLNDLQIHIPSRNFPPTPQSAFFNYGRTSATPTAATASYTLMNDLPLADFLADRFEMAPGHSELVSPASAGYWSQSFGGSRRQFQHGDGMESPDHVQQQYKS